MDLYGSLYTAILRPVWEGGIRRRPTLRILRELEASQWLSRDELAARQARDLAVLLRHAHAHVPYYRAAFQAAGVTPADVTQVDDLIKLPLLRRVDARDAGAARESSQPPRVEIRKSTSGTSGSPLAFGYDRGSEYWRQAIKLRGYGWAGYRLGQPTVHLWGPAPPLPRAKQLKIDLDRRVKREVYVDCMRRRDEDLARAVAIIRAVRPHAILAYSHAAATLARYVERTGSRGWGTIPVLCGAEQLTALDRAAIEQAFGPAVFDTYGSRETMLMASECEAHDGLHVQAENIIVEVVVFDGERQRAARPGETGQLVVTDLHNLGMPFIRYVNGDLGRAGKATTCACGRALPRIEAIEGRITDTLRDGQGGEVGGIVFLNTMVPIAGAVRQFQAVQHRDGAITLKIVPTPAFDDAARAHIASMTGRYLPGVAVTVELVDDIPPSPAGKRQMVVVE